MSRTLNSGISSKNLTPFAHLGISSTQRWKRKGSANTRNAGSLVFILAPFAVRSQMRNAAKYRTMCSVRSQPDFMYSGYL